MSNQYLDNIDKIIASSVEKFNNSVSIQNINNLPSNWKYPMNHWYKVKDVISVFVDIKNSTGLSATSHQNTTANIYEFFTGTAIKTFHNMWAEYIDIKWDWVFALFSKNKPFTAFASAITFKTFADNTFIPKVTKKLNWKVEIWYHMWIDQKTVLVKSLWLKNNSDRDDRKNEVWAWKPINMSAKLASLSDKWELYVSDRYYENINTSELVTKSCWCTNSENHWYKEELWNTRNLLKDNRFDFNKAYVLKSNWCEKHWKDWCNNIIQLDN